MPSEAPRSEDWSPGVPSAGRIIEMGNSGDVGADIVELVPDRLLMVIRRQGIAPPILNIETFEFLTFSKFMCNEYSRL